MNNTAIFIIIGILSGIINGITGLGHAGGDFNWSNIKWSN